jgi:beta-RFAP synthase
MSASSPPGDKEKAAPTCVAVSASARLHLGFIDMHGGLGRRFGSLGLSVSDVATRLTVVRAVRSHAEGPGAERALRCAQTVLQRLGIDEGVFVQMREAIPEHAGLGSGTQMALAVAAAVARLYGRDLPASELATLTGRGLRSGIGIGVFNEGGFIVDGGRGPTTIVPPVVARLPFPDPWRIVLMFDSERQGVHGAREVQAFADLPEMSSRRAGDLCRIVLVQMLPALAERDFEGFAGAVTSVQDAMSDLFGTAQGGRYTSPRVGEVLGWMRQRGVLGLGQSSWGPTGFAMFANELTANAALEEARQRWGDTSMQFRVVKGLNHGTRVEDQRLAPGTPLVQVIFN